MTNLEFKGSKNMDSFKEHIQYWIDYDGSSEGYRKKHDLDCILTDGNLCADTLISLWLPLRYVLDKENTNKWKEYLKGEDKEHPLKQDKTFLKDLKTILRILFLLKSCDKRLRLSLLWEENEGM